jgi:hypothetical protein
MVEKKDKDKKRLGSIYSARAREMDCNRVWGYDFRAGSERTWDEKKIIELDYTRKRKTTAPRIPVWSPTMVLTRRHFG